MRAVHLYVDNANVVFGPDSSDSRDSSCTVRMVATVCDGAQDTIKRVAEASPHAISLSSRLDGLGGCSFGDGPSQADLMHLPLGGATTDVVAYVRVRGPLLVNNTYNEERLILFQESRRVCCHPLLSRSPRR